MQYKDRRFSQDPRFRYFCLNTLQRHEALSQSMLFANISGFNGSIFDLQSRLASEPSLIKRFMYYGSKIRGSNPFWYQRQTELKSMILQLGIPTLFITLSAADLWWPCLVKHFDFDISNKTEKQIGFSMQELLSKNPNIADHYFSKRVDIFIDILKEKLKITDYWFRYEYQHRGSPHVHGLFWLEGAPDVTKFPAMNDAELECARKFYDDLMSAMNPLPSSCADIHPCRLNATDIQLNDEKLSELLNRVQRHTKCSEKYCLRNQKCRFKFPKDLQECSVLAKNDKGHYQYLPKRNDSLLNNYNPFITQLWRANTDVQIIDSEHAVISYIAKYASKGEPTSSDYKDLLLNIVGSLRPNDTLSKAIGIFMMKLIGNRDISACEVMRLLSGDELYRCTRQFTKVYISIQESVLIPRHFENDQDYEGNKILKAYESRNLSLETMTLSEFAKTYSVKNARTLAVSKNRKHRIVQVVPSVIQGKNDKTDETFYKQKLALHSNWREIESLKTHSTWKLSYENSSLSLLEIDLNLTQEDVVEEIPDELDPHDWMALAAAMPNQNPIDIPLGFRDIDRTEDWYRNLKDYPDVADLQKFVVQSRQNFELVHPPSQSHSVKLNTEQKNVVDFVLNAINCPDSARQAIVIGAAGTGKSFVISEIVHTVGIDSILLMAPTGVAANNINGQTIHSALHLCVSKKMVKLTGNSELQFQEEMALKKVIICDEFSMIGLTLMGKIDSRLRQANPAKSEEPFGGYIIIFFGDFNQLQPVCDIPLYSTPSTANELAIQGKIAYSVLMKVFKLKTILRQQGESQNAFKATLNRLAMGEVIQADYELLSKRFVTNNYDILPTFQHAIRLMSRNQDIDLYNYEKLRETGFPVCISKAIHNNSTAAGASSNEANGLEVELPLCKGARVMLRQNLWTAAGLCNGSLGEIADIVFELSAEVDNNSSPSKLPLFVLIKFDCYTGPTVYNGLVPIIPVTSTFRKKAVNCSRKQLPLSLAFAMSIHKSQGITLEKAVVDIGPTEFATGISYVGCSRVKTIDGLLLHPSFNDTRLTAINNKKGFETKKSELLRLKELK